MAGEWAKFFLCTLAILVSGAQVCRYSDVLAEKTGMGRTWMGLVVLAEYRKEKEEELAYEAISFKRTLALFGVNALVVTAAGFLATPDRRQSGASGRMASGLNGRHFCRGLHLSAGVGGNLERFAVGGHRPGYRQPFWQQLV
jgi:hypothetical protein